MTGLEPATLGTTNRCSNQLSYNHRKGCKSKNLKHIIASGYKSLPGTYFFCSTRSNWHFEHLPGFDSFISGHPPQGQTYTMADESLLSESFIMADLPLVVSGITPSFCFFSSEPPQLNNVTDTASAENKNNFFMLFLLV
jgi:hypothetical protein